MSEISQWGNMEALQDVLAKQIAHLETITHLQKEIEKLKVTEQSLRETIGDGFQPTPTKQEEKE